LDEYLIKPFGSWLLSSITSDDVRAWHTKMGKGTPTARSHAYGLLRTIMGTATSDGKISLNPCVIRGAGNTKRVHKIRPATLPELEAITNAMPVQYQAMILLASWCALRFGELTELRRKDRADRLRGDRRRGQRRRGPGGRYSHPAGGGARRRRVPGHHAEVGCGHPRRSYAAEPGADDQGALGGSRRP
jgi:integrase